MIRRFVCLGLLLFSVTIFAQSDHGRIAGTVTFEGVTVGAATVQARNTATGKLYQTLTAKTGSFTIAGLPAGTYDLSVPPLGLSTSQYTRKGFVVGAGKTERLDIPLIQSNRADGVIGNDAAFFIIHNKYAGLTGPTPHTPAGKPDFSGVWLANVDPDPEAAAPLPWAAEALKQRVANHMQDYPWALCQPPEPFPSIPVLCRIVQNPSVLVQVFYQEPHYRQVYLDGRGHPKDPDPQWMGHSVGRWEGDTLVIDSVGFNDRTWLGLDLLPHTEQLHVVERYRRPDLGHLTVDVTMEDPGALAKPFIHHMIWELAPGEDIEEYICTENNKYLENTRSK
jgi:hypothetical protein